MTAFQVAVEGEEVEAPVEAPAEGVADEKVEDEE